MKFSRRLVLTFFSGFVPLLLLGFPATAETVINVSLWDKGPTSMDNMDTLKPMGMAMAGANMEMATMGIKVDVSEISAGSVTFRVLNESQDFYHSLAISLVEDPSKELPYLIDKKMVDEDAAGRAAQVKELKPHELRVSDCRNEARNLHSLLQYRWALPDGDVDYSHGD